ncbi:T9SS type A sorting domain-containing protein, partial [Nonlabens sp.]|uniref:T9SS type A sorting domain-containing protein n=1 Tax=Nonlabens sp. TaxID=1888209 RepID=UPI003F699546
GFSIPYSLNDFERQYYLITMSTPVTGVQMGDTFTHNVTINPSSTDLSATNNMDSIDVDVVASYDPNDVTEIRGPIILVNEFSSSDYLEYTIRFQNMGSAAAQFVRILSDLHPLLDDSTFEILTASHPYSYEKNGRSLDFFFDDIQLPPEATDPEGSNGFIKYRIKPISYAVGDVIRASAAIYFDYNAPVFTEIWTTTFNAPASVNDILPIAIYPNPLQGNVLHLKNINQGDAVLYALDGREIWNGAIKNSKIKFNDLNSGIYLLKIESQEQSVALKLVVD